jgi:hypothetical protein
VKVLRLGAAVEVVAPTTTAALEEEEEDEDEDAFPGELFFLAYFSRVRFCFRFEFDLA